jgi:hypothetical protein
MNRTARRVSLTAGAAVAVYIGAHVLAALRAPLLDLLAGVGALFPVDAVGYAVGVSIGCVWIAAVFLARRPTL